MPADPPVPAPPAPPRPLAPAPPRHDLNRHFAGWIAYTLSRSVRRDSGQSTDRLFDFDQTHILTAVATYLLPRNWQIGGRFRLVSGNPRTPIVGAVFNAAVDRYDPVFGPVNSARNEPFHQLDLRIDKRWVFKGWMLNVYPDVQNVYNRRSPEGVTYNYDFRQSKVQQGLRSCRSSGSEPTSDTDAAC